MSSVYFDCDRIFASSASSDGGSAHHPEITVRTAYDLKPYSAYVSEGKWNLIASKPTSMTISVILMVAIARRLAGGIEVGERKRGAIHCFAANQVFMVCPFCTSAISLHVPPG